MGDPQKKPIREKWNDWAARRAVRYEAPFEKSFRRVIGPFEKFIQYESTSGILLLACALVSFFLVNSSFGTAFQDLLRSPLEIRFPHWALSKTVQHWVNDGLMSLFFFLVGLEIKRELLVGELSDPRKALLPIFVAAGGMAVPALVYVSMNPWGIAVHGFGIPMATDIAFGLGILTLLHKRVPKSLFVFFLSFAIVDDIGAVLLIALFYSKNLSLFYLTLALMVTAVLVLLNLFGVRGSAFYLLFGVGLWYLTLKSGIHATVAGILLAAAIPSKPKFNTFKFSLKLRGLLREFDSHHPTEKTFFPTPEQRAILRALGEGIKQAEPPLVRLEHSLHAPVAFLVMPLFALVNAGTKISLGDLGTIFSHPVTLGVSFGLVAGKFVGILGAAWISQKLGIARLPNGMNFRYVVAAALLGGIGFTMSIFIAELAFEHFPEFLWASKLGILLASFLAGTLGFWVLRREPVLITGEEPSRSSGEEESD